MNSSLVKEKPNFFKRRVFLYTVAGLVLTSVLFGFLFIIIRQNANTVNRFNQQFRGIARTSTVYLVSNYELYGSPQTIKFENIVKDFLAENSEVANFRIFNTVGQIVFNSENLDAPENETVKSEILDSSRNNEIVAINGGNRIEVLVSPYFEEWGSHRYSVSFYPSYAQVNRENWQFSLELGIITILLIIVIATIALLLILNERYKIHKEERDKLEAIDKQRQEFIMLVAHNLRTPITIIQGYISMLADMDISAEQKKMLEPVTETVRTLYLLVEQIVTITEVLGQDNLSFAKQDVGLKEIIANVVNEYQDEINKNGLQVSQTYNPEAMLIYTNERYIKMVFLFLIENAIKFNKAKGQIYIKGYLKDSDLVISIADTGIGINKAEQENIFVKFHKSDIKKSMYEFNYKGAGLGLYTAKILVNVLGGKIWFESTEGVGTTFFVSLPVKPPSLQG